MVYEDFDLTQAKREGWTISTHTGSIVVYNGPECRGLPYDSDDQARRVVQRNADGGSEYHRHAIAIANPVPQMHDERKRIEKEYRLGNLTKFGVVNHMVRVGFKMSYAREVAEKLEDDQAHADMMADHPDADGPAGR